VKGDWVSCPKPQCRRRIFRWTDDGIEVAPGARVMQPMDRTEAGWTPRADEVAIAQCPYPVGDFGCGQDHRVLAVTADQFGARHVIARATHILRERRGAVLALADRVERDRRVTP
jgi:hypothetical protein